MGGADLQDKVAVVTGAAQGIGRAIAQLLGRRAAKIVVNDISEQQAATTAAVIRKQGGTAIEVIADVTGFTGRIEWDTTKPNGQPRRSVDGSRARELFGFEARTPLRRGLERTVAWYREQTHAYAQS